MNTKYIASAVLAGAIIIGGFAVFTNTSNGQTIKVTDDGVKPVDVQKIVITQTATKSVVTPVFEGTLSDLVNEELPRLYRQRDEINSQITAKEALRDQIQAELNKLPARSVAVDAEVIPK